MPGKQRLLPTALVILLVLGFATGWTQSAGFGTTVHGHEFNRVTIGANGCKLDYRFDFNAPADRYQGADPKAPRFRFVGRIKLKSGAVVRSPIFPNAASGERKYENSFDTSSEGCWAKDEQKLTGFDVRGCRGQGCIPDPFD
jgi:hypothetical protein